MDEKKIEIFSFIECSRCGGELHPIRPGTTAPEYFCPTVGKIIQVHEGDELVAAIHKDEWTKVNGRSCNVKIIDPIHMDQFAKTKKSSSKAGSIFGVLFLIAIAILVYVLLFRN